MNKKNSIKNKKHCKLSYYHNINNTNLSDFKNISPFRSSHYTLTGMYIIAIKLHDKIKSGNSVSFHNKKVLFRFNRKISYSSKKKKK